MGYFIIFLILVSFTAFHFIDRSLDYRNPVDRINGELSGLKVWRAVKLQKGVDPDWVEKEYQSKKYYLEEQIQSAIKEADDNEMWG